MIPLELPNWMVAIPVLVITVILIAWSGDLIPKALSALRSRRALLLDGSLWLGLFFLFLAMFMSGAITVILLANPHGTVPSWFGIGMVPTMLFGFAAWYLLTFTSVDEDSGDER